MNNQEPKITGAAPAALDPNNRASARVYSGAARERRAGGAPSPVIPNTTWWTACETYTWVAFQEARPLSDNIEFPRSEWSRNWRDWPPFELSRAFVCIGMNKAWDGPTRGSRDEKHCMAVARAIMEETGESAKTLNDMLAADIEQCERNKEAVLQASMDVMTAVRAGTLKVWARPAFENGTPNISAKHEELNAAALFLGPRGICIFGSVDYAGAKRTGFEFKNYKGPFYDEARFDAGQVQAIWQPPSNAPCPSMQPGPTTSVVPVPPNATPILYGYDDSAESKPTWTATEALTWLAFGRPQTWDQYDHVNPDPRSLAMWDSANRQLRNAIANERVTAWAVRADDPKQELVSVPAQVAFRAIQFREDRIEPDEDAPSDEEDAFWAGNKWTQVRFRAMQIMALRPLAAADDTEEVAPPKPSYRTGVQGRPSSKHLVEAEMRRHFETGQLHTTLSAEVNSLGEWLTAQHPDAPPMTKKGAENALRHLYKELLRRKNEAPK